MGLVWIIIKTPFFKINEKKLTVFLLAVCTTFELIRAVLCCIPLGPAVLHVGFAVAAPTTSRIEKSAISR